MINLLLVKSSHSSIKIAERKKGREETKVEYSFLNFSSRGSNFIYKSFIHNLYSRNFLQAPENHG